MSQPLPASKRQLATERADLPPLRDRLFRDAPPWVVSAVFHMVLLVVLGLWVITDQVVARLSIEATLGDDLGDFLADPWQTISPATDKPVEDQLLTPENVEVVDEPLAAPDLAEPLNRGLSAETLHAPQIGLALRGRQQGMKQALLAAFGGNSTTEAAVTEGLNWLARQQARDGSWSLKGPYADGSYVENRPAATAMAMLAFLGAGNTHLDRDSGPFTRVVRRGLRALLYFQDDEGNFFREGGSNHRIYTHAQCAIALCELYGMTADKELLEPAQRAVDYCVKIQAPEGGWRYIPGAGSDTSVTGWVLMALQSAKMGYLVVPEEVWSNVSRYLDRAAKQGGRRYVYRPGEPFSHSSRGLAMTAEGLLCRQYLGWRRSDPRLRDGVDYLAHNLMDWQDRDVYYWYYASQVCHHMGGKPWQKWNRVMRQLLPAKQIATSGRERGSWDPDGDAWGPHGGRLFVTCLSVYMLEVYYRHLPIYQSELLQ